VLGRAATLFVNRSSYLPNPQAMAASTLRRIKT